jgi:phage protein D
LLPDVRAVDQASSAPELPSATLIRKNGSNEDIKKLSKVPAKRSKSAKDLLQGVVVAKKRNSDEHRGEKDDKPAKRPHVEGKLEKGDVAKNENTKNQKQDNSLAAKTQTPIASLVTYGGDSSSDED